jgi:hypothetical protein
MDRSPAGRASQQQVRPTRTQNEELSHNLTKEWKKKTDVQIINTIISLGTD